MIVIGGLVALWGVMVLLLAPGLHSSWRRMNAEMRRAGVTDSVFGARFLASDTGLRVLRIAGAAALVGGLAALAAGLVRAAG